MTKIKWMTTLSLCVLNGRIGVKPPTKRKKNRDQKENETDLMATSSLFFFGEQVYVIHICDMADRLVSFALCVAYLI